MKNLRLLTVALVLAELMVVNHNAMASESLIIKTETPRKTLDNRFVGGGMACLKRRIAIQKAQDEKILQAEQKAIQKSAKADAAEAQIFELQQRLEEEHKKRIEAEEQLRKLQQELQEFIK